MTDTRKQLRARLHAHRRRQLLLMLLAALATLLLAGVSCFAGVAELTPQRLLATFLPALQKLAKPLTSTELTVLLQLRLPRIVMGLLAGIGLSVSGLVMQAITGNSMASPFTTGLSNAAAMGAAVGIVFSLRLLGSVWLATVAGAFLMALVCMLLVYGIAAAKGLGSGTLVLVGIALNYFFSALNAGMQYLASEEQLSAIVN